MPIIALKIFTLLLLTSGNCYAYIDGQVSLALIQILLALIGGIIVFLKNPIKKIKKMLDKYFRFRK